MLFLLALLATSASGGPAEGADEVELALHSDNLVPVVVLSLEVPRGLWVDVEGLCEELSVEAGEDVVAVALLALLLLLLLSSLLLRVKLVLWVAS